MEAVQHLIPDLVSFVVSNLPIMFTEKALNDKIRPLLGTAACIRNQSTYVGKINKL